MPTRVIDRRFRYTAFVLFALSINLIDAIVLRWNTDPARRIAVAAAATVDTVGVVSVLYYWLLVRPGFRRRGTIAAVALAGAFHATWFYPDATTVRAGIAGLCEAGFVAFVIVRLRRAPVRGPASDPFDLIRQAIPAASIMPAVARLLSGELAILYYALFSWRAKAHVAPGSRAFSIYKRVGQADLLGVLAMASVLEVVPVHLVLRRWNPAAGWIVTAVSIYGAIWLIGLARAFPLRPVLIGPDYLHLRYGLLFDLRVPRGAITCVRRTSDADRIWAIPRKSDPQVCIELSRPLDGTGLFGLHKSVRCVAITPDDEQTFVEALAELTRAA